MLKRAFDAQYLVALSLCFGLMACGQDLRRTAVKDDGSSAVSNPGITPNSAPAEICDNGIDDDGDALTDCQDAADCSTFSLCAGGASGAAATGPENCTDGVDNDGDSFVDCNDWDCDDDTACGGSGGSSGAENCTDGADNDGDSFVDCDDWDCDDDVACGGSGGSTGAENCTDGVDNDGDSFIDCNDWDCDNDPACGGTGGAAENCTDGSDNDGDSFIDCNDWDCDNDPACGGTGGAAENCTDGVDNDGDSFIDCNDWDCDNDPACGGTGGGAENCTDGVDNDGDSFIDCNDWDCDNDPACGGTGGGDSAGGDVPAACLDATISDSADTNTGTESFGFGYAYAMDPGGAPGYYFDFYQSSLDADLGDGEFLLLADLTTNLGPGAYSNLHVELNRYSDADGSLELVASSEFGTLTISSADDSNGLICGGRVVGTLEGTFDSSSSSFNVVFDMPVDG